MSTRKFLASTLAPVITRILALKKALGRKYSNGSTVLRSLDAFLSALQPGSSELTHETFSSWCCSLQHLTPGVRRKYMQIVRNLCIYRRRTEPTCFVPDPELFPQAHQPVKPYIFTEAEIAHLLGMTRMMKRSQKYPTRPDVFRLAIILLYTTGLRSGELLNMTIGDYKPQEHSLLIRSTKFHKSRYLPLSSDGIQEIERYLCACRTHKAPAFSETPLVWNGCSGGRGYSEGGFANAIRRLLKASGIRTHDGRVPRVHDFRHSFAVNALLRWYRSGANTQAKLPLLSTYMGHVSIVSTQYYLPFVESLSTEANTLFAKQYSQLVTAVPEQKGGK